MTDNMSDCVKILGNIYIHVYIIVYFIENMLYS